MGLNHMLAAVAGTGGIRVPEIGKVKLGGLGERRKTKDGKEWRMPRKDDHFTITGLARNSNGDLIVDKPLMDTLIERYGDPDGKLRQIPIRLLSDDINECITARFCCYGGKTCWAVSDGEKVTWKFDPATKKPLEVPRVDDWKPEYLDLRDKNGAPLFKLHSNFGFSIASPNGRWGGVYLFRTTSVISFKQLYSSLMTISSRITGGVLVGMPLMMCVRPMLVSPDGKPTNVYVCHVELRGEEIQELQKIALDQAHFRANFQEKIDKLMAGGQKLLVGPGDESPEEAAEIADEFSPAEPDANVIDGTSGPASVSDLLADEPPKDEHAPEPDASEAAAETEPEGQ